MIEYAVVNNGPSDLPLKRDKNGFLLPVGDLEEMNRSFQRIVIDQVRMGIQADELEFHYCFFTEHHFQPEGQEFSPNPLQLGTAIAARTKRIRLGQSANILSWHHPIRIAEQAAMLDVISGGRLEFGVGRGLQPRETDVFSPYYGSSSTDEAKSLQFYEEALEVIIKAWTQPSFSHHGKAFTFPTPDTAHHHDYTIAYFEQKDVGRSVEDVLTIGEATDNPVPIRARKTVMKEMQVFPRPLQKPMPQIWQPVVMSQRSMQRAARLGMNAFVIGSGAEQVNADVDSYMRAAEEEQWPDRLDRGEFKRGWDAERRRGVCHVQYVHLTDRGLGQTERFLEGLSARMQYLASYAPETAGFNKINFAQDPMQGMSFIGGSQQVLDSFMKLKELGGYDDFLCAVDFSCAGYGGDEARDQMQCFAEEVMPHLTRACGGALPRPEPDPAFVF